jgi:hypothetical protein
MNQKPSKIIFQSTVNTHMKDDARRRFESQHLGTFEPESPEAKQLRELAEKYHKLTEDYDRSVCTGPIVKGSIRPANGHESALINRHAQTLNRDLCLDAQRLGFSAKQWHEAVTKAAPRS